MSSRPAPRFHGRVELPEPRGCAHPGCAAPAEFRAPAGNRDAGGWQFLCLDHVRAFNAGYNYFDGLSPDAIAAAQSPLAGWERVVHNGPLFNDPLGAFAARFGDGAPTRRAANPDTQLSAADTKALRVLGLDADAAFADIRRAYKALVRQFHPDTNGGDRSQERKLQDVVQAYTHLKRAPAWRRTA